MLMWGLCNIFIVHGKCTNVGCTMARLCGAKILSHFLCAWHVLKAWRLHSMEKILDPKVKRALLDHLHMVMFMSINLNETIESFKVHGNEIPMESFHNLQLGVVWTRYFWAYYCQPSKWFIPFQVWHVLKHFCYGRITSCMLIFHTYSNYMMGYKYVVHVHA